MEKAQAINQVGEGDDDGSRQFPGCGAINGERSGSLDHNGQANDDGQDVVFVAFTLLCAIPVGKETDMPVDEDDSDHHVVGDAKKRLRGREIRVVASRCCQGIRQQ